MAICPIISAQIVQLSASKEEGYKNVSLFFMMLGIVGLSVSMLLLAVNSNAKKMLDGTSSEKKIYAIELNPTFSDGEFM
jgi:hypothetical protein